MNVQPGNLAMVVAPYAIQGRGAFVEVVRFVDRWSGPLGNKNYLIDGPSWLCNGWVRDDRGRRCGPQVIVGDHCLRRINPGEATDEILRIAGKPTALQVLTNVTWSAECQLA